MSIVGFIIACLGKLKENFSIIGKKDEDNIFKIDILMEGTLAVKKVNNFKLNFDSDLELKNEDYNYYEKVKVIKLNKFYKK